MKQHIINRGKSTNNNLKLLEKNWNQRFTMEKTPKYELYKETNSNTINFSLIKNKLKKEKNQLNSFQKKIKKSKTNSSNLTLEQKSNQYLYFPLLVTKTENDKTDLFSIKFNNTSKNEKLFSFNTQNNSIRNDFNRKDMFKKMYDNTYELKMNKTEENSRITLLDNKFKDEMRQIKELWKLLGISIDYQINFWKMLSKYHQQEIVEQYLSYEKKDLIQFKSESHKLQKEITKREGNLDKLKELDQTYFENENLYNLYNNMNETNKLEGKDEEKLNEYKKKKIELETEIENVLKSLRLHTINTVCLFNKYKKEYNNYFSSGKVDINKMKDEYKFNDAYLLKLKSDTNFLQNSSFLTLYNFSKFMNDPFFLSLLKPNEENDAYKYLTATEDTINKINQCIYIIDQEEILYKMNKPKKEMKKLINYQKINQNIFATNLKKEIPNINRKKIKALLFNKSNPVSGDGHFPLFNTALTDNFLSNKRNYKYSKI